MSKLSLYDDAFLTRMRQQMDPLADQAVAAMYEHPAGGTFRETIATLTTNDYTIPSGLPDAVTHFLEQSRQLPPWADKRLLRRGHDFFARQTPELLLMLGLLSLPYDYAAADGAQVLYLSERLRNDPGKRLAETGQYVLDVGSKDAFGPKGKAICSAQKVRLIHAAIRYHLRQDERWNFDWGQPVNQEDMAGTNLSMSLLPVRGMRQLGIRVSADDQLAYVHLWSVASYVMGVDERLLPDTGKEAFWLTKLISERHHRPSEAGRVLAKSLLTYLQQNAPSSLSALAPAYMRLLLGDTVADILDLPDATLPPALLASPLQGLSGLRNLTGWASTYQAIRQRMQQEIKRQRADAFRTPERLGTS
ncbi:MAG: oxygenase MpaB family protein [Tunicatimonas sp.]